VRHHPVIIQAGHESENLGHSSKIAEAAFCRLWQPVSVTERLAQVRQYGRIGVQHLSIRAANARLYRRALAAKRQQQHGYIGIECVEKQWGVVQSDGTCLVQQASGLRNGSAKGGFDGVREEAAGAHHAGCAERRAGGTAVGPRRQAAIRASRYVGVYQLLSAWAS
jgi:hypothetical protein